MKVSFQVPGAAFGNGQLVKGEVLGSGEGGSMAVLNGIPVRTDKALTPGRPITGRIEKVDGEQAVITLQNDAAGGDAAAAAVGDELLTAAGLPADPENKALLNLLRRFNLPLSPELILQARDVMTRLNLGTGKNDLNALGVLLLRKLPESLLPFLKEYLAGRMRMGDLFARLSPEEKTRLKELLNSGELLKVFVRSETAEGLKDLRPQTSSIPEELAENLAFQEILSTPPQTDQEGRLYFQWPFFWQGQDLPDTLEGEAFYTPDGGGKRGFSLRLLLNPPRLGAMEIGIHRVKNALWVHFGLEDMEKADAVRSMFGDLITVLENLDWKSVRLTVGPMSKRPNFLSPPESDAERPPLRHLDLKV